MFSNTAGGNLVPTTNLDQTNINTAVNQWISNPTTATVTYGHISAWDTSRVTAIPAAASTCLLSCSSRPTAPSGVASSASSTGGHNAQGRWSIREAGGEVFLEVHYNSGETRQFRITQDTRNWYLNGEKAFAVNP